MTDAFGAAGSPPTVPRTLTPEEQRLLQRAQQGLVQQRLNAQRLQHAGEHAFRAALRSSEQPRLFVPSAPTAPSQERPSPALEQHAIPACLEAAIERVRRPAPGSPGALALEALERHRPVIEAAVRRRDARHNLMVVMRVLLQAAYALIEARGQSRAHTTTYTLFTVLDLLPAVTGLSSDQCERATRRLQELGLIHKTSGGLPTREVQETRDAQGRVVRRRVYRGGTWTTTSFTNQTTGERIETRVCAGTWVAVLLRPGNGWHARVVLHELPECPRDLTADRKRGQTAWQTLKDRPPSKVRESLSLSGNMFEITPLIQWSLPVEDRKIPGTVDSRTSLFENVATPRDLVWSLSRIVSTHPQRRREAVQEGAARLVTLLNDRGWERHYYRILWRATDAEFRGVPAYAQLAHALERTLVAGRELHITRPGAWLSRQLSECGWMDAVYRHAVGRSAA